MISCDLSFSISIVAALLEREKEIKGDEKCKRTNSFRMSKTIVLNRDELKLLFQSAVLTLKLNYKVKFSTVRCVKC